MRRSPRRSLIRIWRWHQGWAIEAFGHSSVRKWKNSALERITIRAALAELRIEAFVFEKDAGARPDSIQQTYLEELEAANLYIGVFWKGYGKYTIEEYENAQTLGMDCLIYEKREEVGNGRDPELQAFLDRIGQVETGLTIRWFHTPEELSQFIKEDVSGWQFEIIEEATKPTAPAVYHDEPSKPPPDFVGRNQEIERMVRELRSGKDLAVEGLPGVGKTTLAVAIAHHPGIRRRFKDGVLWASLGLNADVASALMNWANALERAGILNEDVSQVPGRQRGRKSSGMPSASGACRLSSTTSGTSRLQTRCAAEDPTAATWSRRATKESPASLPDRSMRSPSRLWMRFKPCNCCGNSLPRPVIPTRKARRPWRRQWAGFLSPYD